MRRAILMVVDLWDGFLGKLEEWCRKNKEFPRT
jgi:hypothetical protein